MEFFLHLNEKISIKIAIELIKKQRMNFKKRLLKKRN